MAHEQERRCLAEHIVALRQAGHTWDGIAAAVGLVSSRVRAIYNQWTQPTARPDDEALIANLRVFLGACQGQPSRRAYAAWPGRAASPATIANRFGTWAQAITCAQLTNTDHTLSA